MSEPRTHFQTCTLCEATCGIAITVEGDRVTAIKGDPADHFSRGYICPKATALQDLHADPDRLRVPMERTADGWREVSWDHAFDAIAERVRGIQARHGHDAVAAYAGNPVVHNLGALLYLPQLLRSLRTRNKFAATSVDQLPHHVVAHAMFGHQLLIPVPDIDHTDFMIILGGNPVVSNGSIMTVPDVKKRLRAIVERSGELVVIDPKRTATAGLASTHHFVRPGTDVLLLLAMLHVAFADDLVDAEALPGYLGDWGPLRAAVAPFPPERVASITGWLAADIRDLVHRFAGADTGVIYGRLGVSTQQFGGLAQYLIMVLNVLLGRLDTRGGLMFTTPAVDVLQSTSRGGLGRKRSRVRGLPAFGGELPAVVMAEEMLTPGEGQIRALITMAGNPVLSTPDGARLEQALEGLECFVSIDLYINETNAHAHFILPPASPLERPHYDLIFNLLAVRNTARFSEACFEKPPGARHDWEILAELTRRLQPDAGPKAAAASWARRAAGPERLLDLALRAGPHGGGVNVWKGLTLRRLKQHPHGLDLGPLEPVLPGRLFTRSGTVEFALELFVPDIERVEEAFFGGAQPDPGFPLALIGRRSLRSNNSWLHNSHRMVKGPPRCTLEISPGDATDLGIVDGQEVRVESKVGAVTLPAAITEAIMPGVVSIPHGWGHHRAGTRWRTAEAHAGVSVNDLTDPAEVDDLTGTAVLNGVPVRVGPAGS